jgi:hypothetical protein
VGHGQVEVDRGPAQRHAGPELGGLGEPVRLAGLGDHRRHQICAPALDVVEERVEHAGAVPGRQVGPGALVEAAAGLGDRPPDLGERGGLDVGDRGLVGRVLDRKRLVAADPAPGDVGPALRDDRPLHGFPLSSICPM